MASVEKDVFEKNIVKVTEKKQLDYKNNATLIILLVTIIFFSIFAPGFLSVNNFINVLRQVSITGIAAMGMMMVILTGGIDLSQGSLIGITGALAAYLMTKGEMGIFPAVIISILLSLAYGYFNGFMISKFNVPPMVGTLATMTIGRGFIYVITQGISIYGFNESFKIIGQGYVGPIPIPVIVFLVFIAITAYILTQTPYGTHLYAIGGNSEAASLSGVNVGKTQMKAYIISALFAGIAGLVLLGRLGSASASLGNSYEMDIITAVVLGGVSISGGSGKLRGVVFGVIIMGLLSNGLLIMGLSEYYQMIAKGIILLIAIVFDKNIERIIKSTEA